MDDATPSDEPRPGRHLTEARDAAYAAYERHPVEEPDEWGDLASFRAAAGSS